MKKSKKQMIISITAIVLIVVLILGATYAYFAAQYGDGASTNITVNTSTVDNLTFTTGDEISISANQSNFSEGSGNQSGSTYASATLVANNDTNSASANYYLYIKIDINDFEYTTSDKNAELILTITGPDGNEVTSLSGLTYTSVTDGDGNVVSGFDITSKIGLITIAEDYLIESTGTNTQEWNIEVTLVNLSSDQSANAGASFSASLVIQSSVYGNTLQAVGSSTYTEKIWAYKDSITKIVFDDTGNTIIDYEEVYDISSSGDGSILAYLVSNDSSSLGMLFNDSLKNKINYLSNEIAETNTYTTYVVSDLPILGNEDMSYWFYNFTALEEIEGLDKLITSNVTNMLHMFQYCANLTELDLSTWNTSKVTDMSYMFNYCSGLKSLNLSEWDTSNVTTMKVMFQYCTNLTELDLSTWNTSKVTDMSYMFVYCSGLKSLNLSGWDTSSVTTMLYMFNYCTSLTTLDLSMFDTSKVTTMRGMLQRCASLTSLDLRNFDTSNVTDMSYMFYNSSSLISLDLSNFNTSKVTTMQGMFQGCSSLTSIDLSSFDTLNVTNMLQMFGSCIGLKTLDVSSFDTSSVENMQSMFYGCSGLTSLDLSNFDTSNVTTMENMFNGSSGILTLNLSNATFTSVTSYSNMFNKNNSAITITVKDSTAYDFITARLSDANNGGTVVIA